MKRHLFGKNEQVAFCFSAGIFILCVSSFGFACFGLIKNRDLTQYHRRRSRADSSSGAGRAIGAVHN